ncbi:MAG TPA: rhombotarget lipoprotein [Lacunisphaera sp.]|nr:rhombotarget lipoprotein [Lacunisphaera sp.]
MKTNRFSMLSRLLWVAVVVLGVTACVGIRGPHKSERSSSVVDFLYPNQEQPLITPGIPVLRLPLRVGLAFVPTQPGRNGSGDFSEAQKSQLLRRVADAFRAEQFIGSLEVIPSTYLRSGGGFDNLDRLRGLLGLDVAVLVAYDQVQFTDQNKLSLAYWTIVGAYVFKGNKNDTDTLLEAVVYDIPSRKLLFRAPGANRMKATSTAIEAGENLRRDSAASFDRAADDLITNLRAELAAFRERVKQAPDEVRIEHRPGYTGGGAVSGWLAGALLLLGLGRLRRR